MPGAREDEKPRVILEEFKIKESANDYGFSDEHFSVSELFDCFEL